MSYQQIFADGISLHKRGSFEKAIGCFEKITDSVDIVNYLLIGKKNDIPKGVIIECFYNAGVCYKEFCETQIQKGIIGKDQAEQLFSQAIEKFRSVLALTTVHPNSTTNIVSMISTLCTLNNDNVNYCISKLQDALFYDPASPIVHYNLGFMFQRANRLEPSIIHYRLAIRLLGDGDPGQAPEQATGDPGQLNRMLQLNCYYGISCVYRSIKQWPEALYYSLQGARIFPTDPDINNQLGVIYTEMRRTDLAENCYKIAIKHVKDCRITHRDNWKGLLSDLYLNYGQMHSYNGDSLGSIDCYNKSLEENPKALLAFQNKIMNLNYISDQLTNPDVGSWIKKQHQLINKLLPARDIDVGGKTRTGSGKLAIGFVSGDWVDHPVSYFIRGILRDLDRSRFSVYCYSETIIDTSKFPKDIQFTVIKNKSPQEVFEIVNQQHHIDILFDLSGHTAANRLDIFNYRVAPIQITYLGYPNTTGLRNMDYRLTDSITDPEGKVEAYYTERLIRMNRCFLNYSIDPNELTKLTFSDLSQPRLRNGFITFGCFNRLNKISPRVIESWNQILRAIPNAIIRFKTKALLNKKVISKFLANFDQSLHTRLDIVECTTNHTKHLLTYNDIDIALDTFPYSGTTTSCEALLMGVPVLTLRDTKSCFHAQNVTCSILENCNGDLKWFICDSINEMVEKCKELDKKDPDYWSTLKSSVRENFLNGAVCDTKSFCRDLEKIMNTIL